MFQKFKDAITPVFPSGLAPSGSTVPTVNEYNEGQPRNPDWVRQIAAEHKNYDSPVNIDINWMDKVQFTPLQWRNYEIEPKKMKITNTGHTLILSGKWHQERPYITGGPLDAKYVFSQLHFHWGSTNNEGSEHTVDGQQYPLEMHVVHFKSSYLTQEHALSEKDGLCVLAYFFKLQKKHNYAFQDMIDFLPNIQNAGMSAPLNTRPLNSLVKSFTTDYFMYWGSITTNNCLHLLLWLLCREPIGISPAQLDAFRQLQDMNEEPLTRNFRNVMPTRKKPQIYHVNPQKTPTLRTDFERYATKQSFASLYDLGGGQIRVD